MEGNVVPLKPIFEKSPLKALDSLPLCPGQVSVRCEELEILLRCAEKMRAHEAPDMWEALLRAGCAAGEKASELPVAQRVLAALERQEDDGSLPMSVEESLAVMRAAFALYQYDAKRPLLEKMVKWCGSLAADMESVLGCAAIRQQSADLMELLENLYRITGKKGILTLCDKVRQGCMDWSGILHTFAVQRPMSRVMKWKDMEAGMEAEQGNEQGFYTRQYLICHGRSLAGGARAAMADGLYSGNRVELSATKAGWEKITRYHGAACGGITCDGMIGGASPSACVDASALGAWAEALCAASGAQDAPWAFEALDVMLENAMPKALWGGEINCLQRVNGLSADCGAYGVYHTGENSQVLAVKHLLRGYAAACSHAVTVRKNGLDVNLYLPGKYAVVVNGAVMNVEITCQGEQTSIGVSSRQEVKAVIRLRVPSATEMTVDCCGEETPAQEKNGYVTLERTWKKGDIILCTQKKKLHVVNGFHQSVCVMLGNTLMTMPAGASDSWAVALMREPVRGEDGSVKCTVATVSDWRRHGDVPADVPVLPGVEGEEREVTLAPYARTCGISLFPKGSRA